MTHPAATAPAAAPPAPSPGIAIVILALAMGGFAIGTTEFAAMTLVPYFARGLAIDEATAAHVISAYALGVVVGAPLLAVLGARLPRKTLLIGFMVLFSAANVAAAFAPNYPMMLLFRFLAGLPHGAYFGVASLVAASLVPTERRTWAVSMMMLGLTTATLLGVPASSFIGQVIGWRWGFGIAGGLALIAVALIALYAPNDRGNPAANPLRELSALANRQVWLTLATGAIGFGGFFAVYTYVASTLQTVTMAPDWAEPMVFLLFGLGMVVGTIVMGRIADRGLMRAAAGTLAFALVMLLIYPFTTHNMWLMAGCVFLIGCTGSLSLALQTHLMDVAGDAQTLAAALNHAAFNTGNALGPWLASIAVAAGYGFPVSGFVGAGLAAGGLVMLGLLVLDQRRGADPLPA